MPTCVRLSIALVSACLAFPGLSLSQSTNVSFEEVAYSVIVSSAVSFTNLFTAEGKAKYLAELTMPGSRKAPPKIDAFRLFLIRAAMNSQCIVIVNSKTLTDSSVKLEHLKGLFPSLQQSCVDDYTEKNSTSVELTASVIENIGREFGFRFEMFHAEEKNEPAGDLLNGEWNRFYEKYPNALGLVRFSRCGMSADGQQILIAAEVAQNSLSARCSLFFLEKQEGQWRLVGSRTNWES